VTSESSLQNTISKRKGAVSFPLGQLSLPDKKEIVQKQLVGFGKKLSDSAFNNQVKFPFALWLLEYYKEILRAVFLNLFSAFIVVFPCSFRHC